MYRVKGLKSFEGLDGIAWSATIHRDNVKIGRATDEGNGSGTHFEWNSAKEKQALEAYVDKLPETEFNGEPWKISVEGFVGGLADEYEANQKFRRKCRTKTLITLQDYKKDEYCELKVSYNKKVKDLLEKKYGADLKEIINERFGEAL